MKFIATIFFYSALAGCAQQGRMTQGLPHDGLAIAFPGAEGFGKYTTGGRGGRVFIVSNLNDKGPGSFREAAGKKERRIIVFAISGTIHLESPLTIRGDVTIAGQTAPGDGICLADQPVKLAGNNIIIRFLRFRMGDRYQNSGKVAGGGSDDAFGGIGWINIIIDHCSMSWSTDEVFTVYNGDSTTLQWNIISEPLNYSYHFEKGDQDFEQHGYGGIWGGRHMTAHHNLFAHCVNRNPRFAGIRSIDKDFVDYRNNVIYNWGNNNIYGGEGGEYNLVNNYFKYGPATNPGVRYRIVNPSRLEEANIGFGKYFVQGNIVDGNEEVSKNNWLGIHMGNGGTEQDKKTAVVSEPFPSNAIFTESALDGFESVLRNAGAILPARDTLDKRIIDNVKNRTGRIIDVQGGFPHGTPYEKTITAWPTLKTQTAPMDTDRDGMPDNWEILNALDPKNPADASGYKIERLYTNIEVYINGLVK